MNGEPFESHPRSTPMPRRPGRPRIVDGELQQPCTIHLSQSQRETILRVGNPSDIMRELAGCIMEGRPFDRYLRGKIESATIGGEAQTNISASESHATEVVASEQ